MSSTGNQSTANPFRFSSEHHDDETSLAYYNYRYYNTELGRWLIRDPIGEQDCVNAYLFIKNNQINNYDYLGMWGKDIHQEATTRWAKQALYSEKVAKLIGESDERVDDFWAPASWAPVISDQNYHFN